MKKPPSVWKRKLKKPLLQKKQPRKPLRLLRQLKKLRLKKLLPKRQQKKHRLLKKLLLQKPPQKLRQLKKSKQKKFLQWKRLLLKKPRLKKKLKVDQPMITRTVRPELVEGERCVFLCWSADCLLLDRLSADGIYR